MTMERHHRRLKSLRARIASSAPAAESPEARSVVAGSDPRGDRLPRQP
jgi:hypothetical protein